MTMLTKVKRYLIGESPSDITIDEFAPAVYALISVAIGVWIGTTLGTGLVAIRLLEAGYVWNGKAYVPGVPAPGP